MNIQDRIQQLCRKLVVLGYYPFQVKSIMKTVTGNSEIDQIKFTDQLKLINILEEYEKLANEYLIAYSK